jgi:hypothetical protein
LVGDADSDVPVVPWATWILAIGRLPAQQPTASASVFTPGPPQYRVGSGLLRNTESGSTSVPTNACGLPSESAPTLSASYGHP